MIYMYYIIPIVWKIYRSLFFLHVQCDLFYYLFIAQNN